MTFNIKRLVIVLCYVFIFHSGIIFSFVKSDVGTIEVTVKDQNDIYRTGIEIIRYDSSWQKIDSKITDENFKATWSDLQAGSTYHFEAYIPTTIVFYSEYWGSLENKTVVSGEKVTGIIRRVMPLSYDVQIKDVNGNIKSEFELGEPVKIIIDVKNSDIHGHNIKVHSQVNRNKNGLIDFDEVSSYQFIPKNSSCSVVFEYKPTEAGNYFVRPLETFIYANGDQLTDTWYWPDSISFKVIGDLERTILFDGITWNIKSGYSGPRFNFWSNSSDNVWVDNEGSLHLKIRKFNSIWYCSEIWTDEFIGYGEYIFQLKSRIDQLDPNVVFGLFTYKDLGVHSTPQEYEIDIEFSSWQNHQVWANNALYAFQYRKGGKIDNESLISPYNYNFSLNDSNTTHKFIWETNTIKFQSFYGHYDEPPNSSYLINPEKIYTDSRVPPDSDEKLHINLWLNSQDGPSDGNEAEVIIKSFKYKFKNSQEKLIKPKYFVYQNYPNPFNYQTTFKITIDEPSNVFIRIVDSNGNLIKTISSMQLLPSGPYKYIWNGTNSDNQTVPSGVYYYIVQIGNNTETKRCLLIR